jgi:hypothetical protein
MAPRLLLAVLLCAGLLAAPVQATTVIERSLPEMGRVSQLVVRGTVVDQQANWTADHGAIQTTIHLHIKQILKGGSLAKPDDIISIVQPGGIVGDRGQLVPGRARFDDGEEVILFLEPSPAVEGAWLLERLSASKFTVSKDAKGVVQAVRDVSDLTFAARGPDGRIEAMEQTPRASFTLDEIRAALTVTHMKKVK